MSIIWIWDMQSSTKAKSLINKRFNVGSFIATIYGANMNSRVLQCKNCWKWGHIASVCRIQGSKYVKYNSSHQLIHHCQFIWCYKANDKTNSPRLETKKGEPCPHSFKYSNYKGEYQANSTKYLFWKHRFNKEWYTKKYSKLWENQNTLICLSVNSNKVWFTMILKFFHRMFKKTILSWTLFLKSTLILILFSFKNHLGPPFALSLVLRTMKENS